MFSLDADAASTTRSVARVVAEAGKVKGGREKKDVVAAKLPCDEAGVDRSRRTGIASGSRVDDDAGAGLKRPVGEPLSALAFVADVHLLGKEERP